MLRHSIRLVKNMSTTLISGLFPPLNCVTPSPSRSWLGCSENYGFGHSKGFYDETKYTLTIVTPSPPRTSNVRDWSKRSGPRGGRAAILNRDSSLHRSILFHRRGHWPLFDFPDPIRMSLPDPYTLLVSGGRGTDP